MGLQLKGESGAKNNEGENSIREEANPWDIPNMPEDKEPYQTTVISNSMTAAIQGEEKQGNPAAKAVRTIIMALVVGAVLIFGGRAVVSVLMPEGEDITDLLRKDAATIAKELGVTFTDNTEWVSQIHQYSNGQVTVKAAEDIGIIYIDGKQAGVHIRSKAYTIYGIQLGQGEKQAYDHTTYPYDTFLSVLNDMAAGKTTTYYYYNNERNDCVALTISDTTNRIVGITYFYDYTRITETLDKF
ncbi:MAG: hypothetical protein NC300_12590 [Bacteroidales bacterium]|nr:hypothetical protein [Clostridium sp.]MCM1204972.1 hypothetical protein [Bacteroidales bacterium]